MRKILILLLALLALPAFADDHEKNQPRDESSVGNFPPIAVPFEALQHPDDTFARLSAKIADGSATIIERRQWYEMRKLYFPYTADALPPADWRLHAMQQGALIAQAPQHTAAFDGKFRIGALGSPLGAGAYTWSHLGPNGDYCVGDPPAAGCPDKGTGRGTAIWVNPNDKNDILIGTAGGGVWKTTDQGTTWTQIFDYQATLSIGSLTAATGVSGQLDNTTTIYVATGEGNFGQDNTQGAGVFKSTDGGSTWTPQTIPWVVAADLTSMNPTNTSIRRIVVDPNNTQKLWIAADSGIYRTTNGGTTWTLVTGLPYYKRNAGDCWFIYWSDIILDDSVSPSIVYAAGPRPFDAGCSTLARQDNGVYRSTDDGATWTNITVPAANCPAGRGYTCAGSGFATSGVSGGAVQGTVGRMTLLRSTLPNKKKLTILVHNTATDQNLGMWTTTDATTATVTWTAGPGTATAWASQGWYALAGAIDPTSSTGRAVVGGLDIYNWAGSGTTLNKTSSWTGWGTTSYAHADHHQLVWVDATTIYNVNDGGFYIGTVGGAFPAANSITWVGRNIGGGVDTVQLYGIGQHPTIANQIHGGLQDNGELQSVVNGSGVITGWNQAEGGDGGFSATDQSNGNNTYEEYVYAIMEKSTNAGATYGTCFRRFGGCTTTGPFGTACSGNCVPDNATEFIAPMELDTNTQTVLYTGSRLVYRNNPAGSTTWASISPDLTTTNDGNDITHIHSAKNNGTGGTLWAGTFNGKVWISTNATTGNASPTWTNRTGTLPARSVTWIDTDPANGQRAVVTFSGFNTGHVFRTTDGGVNWTDVSGALPNEPFETIAINPANTNQAFAGSDTSVYVNDNVWTTNSWTRINNTLLPSVRANMLQFTGAVKGLLRVATHGRGFWETCTLATAAPAVSAAAANGNGRIDVTWTTNGATRYNVYRSTTSGGPYTLVGNSATGTFSDTTVAQNTTYYYVVRGFECAESSNSSEVWATSACDAAPSAVTGLALSAPAGTCTINLSWTASTSSCGGAITYNIYRGAAGFTPSPANRIASNVSGTTYSDNGTLVSGTTYQYIVRAFSAVSNVEEQNTTRVSSAPAAGCTSGPAMLQIATIRSTSGANKIEWVGPTAGSGITLKLCFSTSAFPGTPASCTAAGNPGITANAKGSFTHSGLVDGTTYWYSLYVQNGANFSKAINLKATPQATSGSVKWVFNTTAAVLSPPGIGSVFTSGNDRVLHSITPGAAGGDWPAAWTPFLLNAPAQARPPVPSVPGLGTGKQVYLGAQDGNVYCIDGNSGAQLWRTASPIGSMIQAAANGMFTVYGGAYDLTIVPTRNATSDNSVNGMNALTGATAWATPFNNGGGANGIGVITGDPYIDYNTNRVYFTSRAKQGGTTATAWALSFTNTTATKVWGVAIGDSDSSPTLWNGRLYVGNNDGKVFALDPSNGSTIWSFPTNDGPVKGFINPDFFGTGQLYFATTTKVWAIIDNGASATQKWSVAVSAPSIPLFVNGTLLVGSGDGRLYQFSNLTNASPTQTSVLLNAAAAVGSPSFDFSTSLAYVGTDAGSVYAVSVPIP